MFPVDIQFRDIEHSPFIYNAILESAEKLKKFHHNIVSCHVVVSRPHQHHHQGLIYHVQVRVHVPGNDVVVSREPELNHAHEDCYVAIRDAFDAVKRQLTRKMETMNST